MWRDHLRKKVLEENRMDLEEGNFHEILFSLWVCLWIRKTIKQTNKQTHFSWSESRKLRGFSFFLMMEEVSSTFEIPSEIVLRWEFKSLNNKIFNTIDFNWVFSFSFGGIFPSVYTLPVWTSFFSLINPNVIEEKNVSMPLWNVSDITLLSDLHWRVEYTTSDECFRTWWWCTWCWKTLCKFSINKSSSLFSLLNKQQINKYKQSFVIIDNDKELVPFSLFWLLQVAF